MAKKHNLIFTPKTDDFGESFAKLWSELHGGIASPKVGMILGDTKTGQIAEEFMKKNPNHFRVLKSALLIIFRNLEKRSLLPKRIYQNPTPPKI